MPNDPIALQAEQRILLMRGQTVMLDFHLAELYAVETRALKQAVRRNPDRFPEDFMFELTAEEIQHLVSQTVIPGLGKLGGATPMAFNPYDGQFRIVFDAIRQLRAPATSPAREMGFHTLSNKKPPRKLTKLRKNKP